MGGWAVWSLVSAVMRLWGFISAGFWGRQVGTGFWVKILEIHKYGKLYNSAILESF